MRTSHFVFIILFLIPVVLFGQQRKTLFFSEGWAEAVTPAMQYYKCECYVTENNNFEGAFNCFTIANDDLVKQYFFVNNRLHGVVKEFFENGDLKLEAEYQEGLPMGEWKEWDASGELIIHKTFDESSRLIKDYFVEENPKDMMIDMSAPQQEYPIYGSECIIKRRSELKYECSEALLQEYYKNPPMPPSYIENRPGQTFVTTLKYELSDRGKVLKVSILESSGDSFLDDLASTHVMNMIPFESAKQYGTPINMWMEAEIVFSF